MSVFHMQKISENFRWKFLIGKSAFHLDTNLIRSQAPLCCPLEFPAKIQNGGSDVEF